ncbi:SMI1/KNR4 family protein [Chryseobacterium camelliae]|uniref:SMI1/KNR4 family protein n=1 Tax=Chryseobacterium camelliae TaxID=1265445 RepID=A0ABY7QLX5_9FLAO|nr:SMI1/KNR4 family protein [Chryseobacterium camelliae]WBV60637.1 SMI1/KNR4 family protein [Chryseobacterium camelliae]
MNNKFKFPKDYVSFINNLKDHEINSKSGYIELFPLDELEEINKEYESEGLVPNFVPIGTNGGGVGIFFNKTNNNIYSIPLVGMEENDAVLLADSFSEFIYKFENDEFEIY